MGRLAAVALGALLLHLSGMMSGMNAWDGPFSQWNTTWINNTCTFHRTRTALASVLVHHQHPLAAGRCVLGWVRVPNAFTPTTDYLQDQKDALVHLYHTLNGPEWRHSRGWLSEEHMCAWHGIRCALVGGTLTENGTWTIDAFPNVSSGVLNVESIHLRDNGVSGALSDLHPSFFTNLTSMERLALDFNSISGTLPSEVGLWTGLHYLLVYRNKFQGTVPSTIGSLTRLKYLVTFGNKLSGRLPSQIGKLSELVMLSLFSNSLTGYGSAHTLLCVSLIARPVQANNAACCPWRAPGPFHRRLVAPQTFTTSWHPGTASPGRCQRPSPASPTSSISWSMTTASAVRGCVCASPWWHETIVCVLASPDHTLCARVRLRFMPQMPRTPP